MSKTNEWHSVTASVDRETRDHLIEAAATRSTTVASLIKRALKVYLSPDLKAVADASQISEEQMILKAIAEFGRTQEEKNELCLMDHLARLEFYIARVLYLILGKNQLLNRQIHEEAEKHIQELKEKRQKCLVSPVAFEGHRNAAPSNSVS